MRFLTFDETTMKPSPWDGIQGYWGKFTTTEAETISHNLHFIRLGSQRYKTSDWVYYTFPNDELEMFSSFFRAVYTLIIKDY